LIPIVGSLNNQHTDSDIYKQQRTYSESLKNNMNKPRKNKFNFDSTDLFSGRLSNYAENEYRD